MSFIRTLKGKVVALLSINAFMAIAAFGVLYSLSSKLSEKNAILSEGTSIVRESMQADMMHDAIRGDVLNVLYALQSNKPEILKGAKKDFQEHKDEFLQSFGAVEKSSFYGQLKEIVDSTKPALMAYLEKGDFFTSLSQGAPEEREKNFSAFMEKFSLLEKNMEELGDKILVIKDQIAQENTLLIHDVNTVSLLLSFLQIFSIGLMAFLVVLKTFFPLNSMMKKMISLAKGDIDISLPERERIDEIGEMARSIEVFRDNAIRVSELHEMAARESQSRQEEIKKQLLSLSDALDCEVQTLISKVNEQTKVIQRSAEYLSTTSAEVTEEAKQVTETTNEATTNVEGVAAATEELSSSVQEISRQVAEAASVAQSAVESASRTTQTVQNLAQAATRIGDVVKLISEIASQTNLLALNATIEAARAGESGKGFAVVASEVKNLANQTTKATEEISSQISDIQTATEGAVKAIEEITHTIECIDHISSSIAAAVEQQGSATAEISRNTQKAAYGTHHVSESFTKVTERFESTQKLSHDVQNVVKILNDQIGDLQLSLKRIVRDSYAGNRRQFERFEGNNMSVMLQATAGRIPCKLHNISAGGANLLNVTEKLRNNESCTLSINDYNVSLPALVESYKEGTARLSFQLTTEKQEELNKILTQKLRKAA